ncbi:MAG: cation-translocating P-type ATPase [Eubacterium sp.]
MTKDQGLTTAEAEEQQKKFGKNELTPEKKENFLMKVVHIIAEPMFLLLLVAAVIYFILGEPRDGAIMLIFVMGIISIDVIQEWKTDKTLSALKDLSAPHVKVIRDGVQKTIASVNLVPGDVMLIEEGVKIPADGEVLKASDLRVDESSLTGEAEGVFKVASIDAESDAESTKDYWRTDYCYAGTLVIQGSGYVLVKCIGANTEYGKIGTHVSGVVEEPTPLQKQTGGLVKLCAGIAAVLFALVGIITWFNIGEMPLHNRLIQSILSGITLAMAMIPEEFPVILTVFLSMGAWRLAKKESLVRKLPSVETLGAVSVLCVDKTGTVTMNQMTVCDAWALDGDIPHLVENMGLACETEAYDPMEKAMLIYSENSGIPKSHLFAGRLITEYPFTNETKMMGHVWEHDDEIVVASKGSPERVMTLCHLSETEKQRITDKITALSKEGLRVIAVAENHLQSEAEIPKTLEECRLTFIGLIGLADPPRASVKDDIAACTKAGVRVVMITGDNGLTASSIAKQIGIPHSECVITGDELNTLSDAELQERVKTVSIFSRVIPEHKMRIVAAFKANGEVVAMTGDGVNDAPALKKADIGIAMGKRGSEVSREAADLILMDDNFSTIVETIRDGRRIYDNIRKATGYVFTIHIPIAMASLLAPLLGINPENLLLLPLHVVLLELVIDPTCSIVLERQPAEKDIMERPPRDPKEKMLTGSMVGRSVLQGLLIFVASFGTYIAMLSATGDAALARTMGIVMIMFSNLFLVQVISSRTESVLYSMRQLSHDKVMWAVDLITVVAVLVLLYTPLSTFLKMEALNMIQLGSTVLIAFVAVFWIEIEKWIKRNKQ